MPQIDMPTPGAFSWIALSTSDQNAANSFYAALFGWDAQDRPMGPGGFYTMFRLHGRDAAAAYAMMPDEKAAGIPPHWNLYVSVTSADETAQLASRLGGKICAGSFDIPDAGRMAMLFDPAGAPFAIFQPARHIGFQVAAEPGAFCWADLNTPEPDKAAGFYGSLFGWKTTPGDSGYLHIANGDEYIGGIPPASQRHPHAPPHWLVYIQVTDCAASASQAAALGAKIQFGPAFTANVGTLAVIADPQGAVFALFQPK